MKLQAKQRLLAWAPNNVPKSGGEVRLQTNGKLRRQWSAAVDNDAVESTQVNGARIDRFDIRLATIYMLVIDDQPKGYLNVDLFDNVSASFIAPEVQGRGWARKLYSLAIRDRKVLKSDYSLSAFASALWRSLAKDFDVRYRWTPGYEVEIVDWTIGTGGFVYPVLRQASGELKSLEELYEGPDKRNALDGVYIARPR